MRLPSGDSPAAGHSQLAVWRDHITHCHYIAHHTQSHAAHTVTHHISHTVTSSHHTLSLCHTSHTEILSHITHHTLLLSHHIPGQDNIKIVSLSVLISGVFNNRGILTVMSLTSRASSLEMDLVLPVESCWLMALTISFRVFLASFTASRQRGLLGRESARLTTTLCVIETQHGRNFFSTYLTTNGNVSILVKGLK